MAGVLDAIHELTSKVKRFHDNFKKQRTCLKTVKYLTGRRALLEEQYQIFENLPDTESSLVSVAVEEFLKAYNSYANALTGAVASDRSSFRRSFSVSGLEDINCPETLDTVKNKLHGSQKNLQQLTSNVVELTNQLVSELGIDISDLDDYNTEAEKLEFVLQKGSALRKEIERRHSREIAELEDRIRDQAKKLISLEEYIQIAEDGDQKSISDINELTNKERIYIERIENLTREVFDAKNKNAQDSENLTDKLRLIIKLEQKIQILGAENKLANEKLINFKNHIAGDLSEKGKENYSNLVHSLHREIKQLKTNNPEIKALENSLKKLSLENLRLKGFKNSAIMDACDKVIQYINHAIPIFTGQRSPTLAADVRQFVACCTLVYGKLSEEEKTTFMQVIRIRLGGDAADLVNNSTMENMQELEELLISAYIPKKNFQSLTEEMKRVVQRPGERMQEYGQRLGKLMKECKNSARKEYVNDNAALLQIIEKDAIKTFKRGLASDILRNHLMPIRKNTLTEMIDAAEDIEEESGPVLPIINTYQAPIDVQVQPRDSPSSGYNFSQNNYNRPPTGGQWRQNQNNNGGQRYGNHGNANGYNNRGNFRGGSFNKNNTSNRNNIRCGRCNRMGHSQPECRARMENIFCTSCNKYGHSTRDCRQRVNVAVVENRNELCHFCQRTDHSIEACLYKRDYESRMINVPQLGNEERASTNDTVGPQ